VTGPTAEDHEVFRRKGLDSFLQPIVENFCGKAISPQEFFGESFVKILDPEGLPSQVDIKNSSRVSIHCRHPPKSIADVRLQIADFRLNNPKSKDSNLQSQV